MTRPLRTNLGCALRQRTVDEDKVAQYHEVYRDCGQFLSYQPEMLGIKP